MSPAAPRRCARGSAVASRRRSLPAGPWRTGRPAATFGSARKGATRLRRDVPEHLVDGVDVGRDRDRLHVRRAPRRASSGRRRSRRRRCSASGSRRPSRASFASVAIVTPPAVSVKMPVVRASRPIASTISSSGTAAIAPPVRRATREVVGAVGRCADRERLARSCPAAPGAPRRRRAPTPPRPGAQPAAWAPYCRGSVALHEADVDAAARSRLCSLWNSEPEAIGATIWSGSRQPSCSAVSNASVFEPCA